MPELPEVETVKETLKLKVLNQAIEKVEVRYPNTIEKPDIATFQRLINHKKIINIERRGKWLLFDLGDYTLLSHLRMEGRYYYKEKSEPFEKHEHVIFYLENGYTLRYHDTRKFGRMHLLKKEEVNNEDPMLHLGLEPWDEALTTNYLKEKLKNKQIPIKTVLLDQRIIAGIGNIYANEVLFLSHISPLKKACLLKKKELTLLIENTREILKKAIKQGGTTIRTYESSEGVHGLFQQELCVHEQKVCKVCGEPIVKTMIGGRGTYYCPKCQEK